MRTCSIDGCNRKHQARGYCSKHYNEIVLGLDRHKVTRHCNECGREYTTTRSNGKYCSLECRDVVMRREKRGAYRGRAARPKHHKSKFKVWIVACNQCGTQFNAKDRGAKYCSGRCAQRAAWVRDREASGGIPAAEWQAMPRRCVWCGDVFHSPIPSKLYCSSHCVHCAQRDRGAAPSGSDWITPARRARLYRRDHYLCWICGMPVDFTVDPKTDDMAPTLDHVIPRARGGKDDDGNLRCAHRICNSLKSDATLTEEQLVLDLAS